MVIFGRTGERANLAAARPRDVAAMREQLRQRLSELGVPLPEDGSVLPTCPLCAWRDRETFWRLALEDESAPGATAPTAVDDETLQRLRDLGYAD